MAVNSSTHSRDWRACGQWETLWSLGVQNLYLPGVEETDSSLNTAILFANTGLKFYTI